jgi:galactonate dehydratase
LIGLGETYPRNAVEAAAIHTGAARTLLGRDPRDIEILMEFHSNWNLTAAIRIAQAMEPYKPMWLEDMLLPGNFAQYRELARAARFIMLDLCWCGGLSEGRKIASMAEAYQLPIVPHTAAGPLLFYASTQLTTACTNVWIQESCQRYWEHDWPEMLENPLIPQNGVVRVPELPGFGMQVKPDVWKHPKAVIRTTER